MNASCMIQFCKYGWMVVLDRSFYWSMSSVHSMKGLRKWTKLWIILYFLNTTDILRYHIVASRYRYVRFVIWGFCWREGSRYVKVFGNCSLCWSTGPSSVYLDLPQNVPPSGDFSLASVSSILIIDASDSVVLPCFLHMVDFCDNILVTLFWVC